MQDFEMVLIIASPTYIGSNRPINKNLNKLYVVSLLVLILSIHLVIDGFRWQIIPAYFIWLIAFISVLLQPGRKSSTTVRIFKTIGFVVLLALSIILPLILPVFELSRVTGSYNVSTKDISLEFDREEVIIIDKSDKRSSMIKAWYPSIETIGKEDLYIYNGGRNGFTGKYDIPPSMLNYLNKVEANGYESIQIAGVTFSVLIFSHGYNSKANGYCALSSELVRNGYVSNKASGNIHTTLNN